jgi:hypothetical protein
MFTYFAQDLIGISNQQQVGQSNFRVFFNDYTPRTTYHSLSWNETVVCVENSCHRVMTSFTMW